jgi:hypothetical protein
MIWLTWRRYRVRLILLTLYIAAIIIFMFITEHAFQVATAHCPSGAIPYDQGTLCGHGTPRIEGNASWVANGIGILPALIGMVFGAPLVATELAAQTNRLTWMQGVTRTKWLIYSWLTLTTATVLLMSILALLVQWWATHIIASNFSGGGLIQQYPFMISGVAPIALTIFSLSFGVFVGIAVRRVVSPYPVTFIGLVVVWTFLGNRYRPTVPSDYWVRQWSEAGIYLALSALFLTLAIWLVRRWRA